MINLIKYWLVGLLIIILAPIWLPMQLGEKWFTE